VALGAGVRTDEGRLLSRQQRAGHNDRTTASKQARDLPF
jgi:hypothetical protein